MSESASGTGFGENFHPDGFKSRLQMFSTLLPLKVVKY